MHKLLDLCKNEKKNGGKRTYIEDFFINLRSVFTIKLYLV